MFENIKSICVKDALSFKDKYFITFDIDWCSDKVLSYTLDIIDKYQIKATFFVTHETSLLDRMGDNPNIELGIHPNFNYLLNGDFRYGSTINQVIQFYKKLVPKAISVRSHCLTQGSLIDKAFKDNGLIYECNSLLPLQAGVIKPYELTNGMIKVPHIFEDDVSMVYDPCFELDKYLNYKGIKVFDFHPIHVFLNTENMARYENSRSVHKSFTALSAHRYTGRGAETFLLDLIGELK